MSGMSNISTNVKEQKFDDVNGLEDALATEIASQLKEQLKENNQAKLLLSGGSTPINLYAKLSHYDLDWSKVLVGLVDERYVPIDDKNSNERLIKSSLIQNKASDAQFIGMVFDTDDSDENLRQAEAQNSPFSEENTCVILGMGTDAHTASLFPGDANSLIGLQNIEGRSPLVCTISPNEPKQRISFTLEALLNTKRLFLYITGTEKLNLFAEAKEKHDPIQYPISSFIHQEQKQLELFWADKN
jgi:6-phosphogluconolactonase